MVTAAAAGKGKGVLLPNKRRGGKGSPVRGLSLDIGEGGMETGDLSVAPPTGRVFGDAGLEERVYAVPKIRPMDSAKCLMAKFWNTFSENPEK
jgi:hypothetical protein